MSILAVLGTKLSGSPMTRSHKRKPKKPKKPRKTHRETFIRAIHMQDASRPTRTVCGRSISSMEMEVWRNGCWVTKANCIKCRD